ncbi:hypothetical protein CERSUDRAFT_82365 [Gelatoporia subvermispora B]|uniref:Plasma-membrane choline transporter-domain-containing protein n=1 Tax=Ceriporiopsis subvermispora (strain B) TaxID=914234 RepID=M2RI11_CERS8|nr:hypothetical protein CERSUDRAFT_82365 [Gelatoporia subvermispora B]
MAASFAAYASQFLQRQHSGAASSLSSSQPLFFSFTTDNGSRGGNINETDLDDLDDPHLHTSSMSRTTVRRDEEQLGGAEDDDPYLRLDEEEPGRSRHQSHTMPLLGASNAESVKGWLAHASPLRSPSPSPSNSSADSGNPPPDILSSPSHSSPRPLRISQPHQPPPPPRAAVTLSLTESLLPRDGRTRPLDVFSLPDPRYVPRGRRKFNDSVWITVWCTGLSLCLVFSIVLLFTTRPSRSNLPYTTLLHTVPLLTILIFLSAIVAYAHVFLLRIFVKPVMIGTSVFIPATLFISAIWAFVGSFMWDGDQEPTWGETVGLRLFSLIPLALSLLTARRLLTLPREIHTASSLLTLTTRLLVANPFLLALSPAVLLATLLISIPFITLSFRLLLVGYFTHPAGNPSGWEWHVRGWANWAIAGTVVVWLWTWGVARGLLRVACAGVIGAWYFSDPTLPPPPPTSTHTIHAALFRATQPSLGTVILSALIVASLRALFTLTVGLRALPAYLPLYMRFLGPAATFAVGYLENVTGTLSTHALIYTGLTGDAFFPSAKRARALTGAAENPSLVNYRRRFKTEPPLTLLTVAPLTLTFPFALGTYLFVAHTLDAPQQALSAAMLAGGVTALVGLFCIGLVKDTADTLYICYCIDKDVGKRRRQEVFEAFEYESRRRPAPAPPQRPPPPRTQFPIPQPQLPQPERRPYRNPLPPQHAPVPPLQMTPPPYQPASPPPRAPTPDPFEQESPAEAQPYPDPFSPASSTHHSLSRLPLSQRGSRTVHPEPVLRPPLASYLESDEEGEVEGEESQLFPGSDLF